MWSAKKLLCWLKSYFLKTAETLDSLNWWQRFPIKTRGNGEHLERHAVMLHNEGGTSFFVGVNVAVDRSLITTLNIWQTRVYRATCQAESPFLNVTGARFIICNWQPATSATLKEIAKYEPSSIIRETFHKIEFPEQSDTLRSHRKKNKRGCFS